MAYAIGVAQPGVAAGRDVRHRRRSTEAKIVAGRAARSSTCAPRAIIRDLDLRRPIYKKTAAYGHFGRPDQDFTWEQTTRADDLKSRPRPLIVSMR